MTTIDTISGYDLIESDGKWFGAGRWCDSRAEAEWKIKKQLERNRKDTARTEASRYRCGGRDGLSQATALTIADLRGVCDRCESVEAACTELDAATGWQHPSFWWIAGDLVAISFSAQRPTLKKYTLDSPSETVQVIEGESLYCHILRPMQVG